MATPVPKTVMPQGGGNYTSLFDWEDAFGGHTSGDGDLVSDDENVIAQCSSDGTDDTTAVVIHGWITDATRDIQITGTDFPADGIYDDTQYVLKVTNDTGIQTREPNVEIDHLQFNVIATGSNVATGFTMASVLPAGDVFIHDCIFKGSVVGATGHGRAISVNETNITNLYIWNCVVYDFYVAGDKGFRGIYIDKLTTAYIYNCTVYNCYVGIERDAGTVNVYNCAVFGCDDDFRGDFNTISYCASNDGNSTDATAVEIPVDPPYSALVTDAVGGDFSVTDALSQLRQAGAGDPSSGRFSTDIIGTTRTGSWDIGAFELSGGAPPATVVPQLMWLKMNTT